MIDCGKTENYLKEKARMTNNCINCVNCPLGKYAFEKGMR